MINKAVYAELLEQGISMQIGQLSINPMRRFGKPVYQVHCDDYRNQYSRIHKDILDAVEIFLEMKKDLYGRKHD